MPIQYDEPKQSLLMTTLQQAEAGQKDPNRQKLTNVFQPAQQNVTKGYEQEAKQAEKQKKETETETDTAKATQGMQVDTEAWKRKEDTYKQGATSQVQGKPNQSRAKVKGFGLAGSEVERPTASNVLSTATAKINQVKPSYVNRASPIVTFKTGVQSLEELLSGNTPEMQVDKGQKNAIIAELSDNLKNMTDEEIAKLDRLADDKTKEYIEKAKQIRSDLNQGTLDTQAAQVTANLAGDVGRTTNIGSLQALGARSDNAIMNALNSQVYGNDIQSARSQALQDMQKRGAAIANFQASTQGLRDVLNKGRKDITEKQAEQRGIIDELSNGYDKKASEFVDQKIKEEGDKQSAIIEAGNKNRINELINQPNGIDLDFTQDPNWIYNDDAYSAKYNEVNAYYDNLYNKIAAKYGSDSPMLYNVQANRDVQTKQLDRQRSTQEAARAERGRNIPIAIEEIRKRINHLESLSNAGMITTEQRAEYDSLYSQEKALRNEYEKYFKQPEPENAQYQYQSAPTYDRGK